MTLRVLLLTGIIAFVSPLLGQTSSPSVATSLEQRVADLEAYVTNSPRGAEIGSAEQLEHRCPWAELQRMDDDVRRAGAFYDFTRPGALLWRARPAKTDRPYSRNVSV